MGWKASTIIIHKPTQVNNEALLNELGFKKLKPIGEESFAAVINPDNCKVYIGTYKDNLIICSPDILTRFFDGNDTSTEKTLSRVFPNSEICAIVLHSVVNLWAYSVIKDGKKIRTRAGSADDGTFLEIGEPLDEEKEILSKSTIIGNGQRTYLFEEFDEEPMTEDQVGENFVFAVCKRYFGEELDRAEDLLFETSLNGYSYTHDDVEELLNLLSEKMTRESSYTNPPIADKKPWWKFW